MEALTLEDVRTGKSEQAPAAAVFAMIVRYGSIKRVTGAVGEGRAGQIPVSGSTRVCRWLWLG
jgi:hypothetical protein